MRDPYEVLGVSADADAERIKAAYRRMARATHPDVGGEDFAFRAVQDAYDLLSDPDRRATHDRGAAGSGEDLSDPVSSERASRAGSDPREPAPETSWLDRVVAPAWYEQIPTGPPRIRPGPLTDSAPLWAPFLTSVLLAGIGVVLGDPAERGWILGAFALIPVFAPSPVPVFKLRAAVLLGLLLMLVPGVPVWWGVSSWWQSAKLWVAVMVATLCSLAVVVVRGRRLTSMPVSEARDATQYSVVSDAAADPTAVGFGSLFLVIPAARLVVAPQRGVDAWVLVGRRGDRDHHAGPICPCSVASAGPRPYGLRHRRQRPGGV